MAVSKGGNPLDIVCNVFLNCPPSVPRTVLSGSRQGSRPNVAIGGKDKREREEGVFRQRISNRIAAKQACTRLGVLWLKPETLYREKGSKMM